MKYRKSKGTAIFMALMVIAIVVGISTVLQRLQRIDIRRTTMMLTSEQAYLYTQGVIDWAKAALIGDLGKPVTTWPMILPPTPIADGQGKISGILQDAEGLLNVNNFAQAPAATGNPDASATAQKQAEANAPVAEDNNKSIFTKLLTTLNVSVDANKLIAAISAWTSPSPSNTNDPRDASYAQANPPYRAPHRLMASISELRLVDGVTANVYNALLPYVTALPEPTRLNPDHAPALLKQVAGVKAAEPGGESAGKSSSKYFLLRADVYLEDQHLVLYTMLHRVTKNQVPKIQMLWQSFGTL